MSQISQHAARWGLVCLAVLLVTGCAGKQPFYPVGIWGASTPADIQSAADAGFNFIRSSATLENLSAARRAGLVMLAGPGQSAGSNLNYRLVQEHVQKFDRHPSLHAWYLSDEPDLWHVPPDQVRLAQGAVRAAGRKKTAVTLALGWTAADYGGIADILMVDPYPVNTKPLSTFAQNVKWARLAQGPDKPVYAILQAFNWAAYPQFARGDTNRLRPPNEQELRCMAYMALVERANGLLFYTLRDKQWALQDHPETWGAVTNVVAEIRRREPLFSAEHKWWPWQVRLDAGESKENEVGEPVLGLAHVEVRLGNRAVPEGRYLVAVNTTARRFSARIRIPARGAGPIPVMGEKRTVEAGSDGLVRESFDSHAVKVFGPLR